MPALRGTALALWDDTLDAGRGAWSVDNDKGGSASPSMGERKDVGEQSSEEGLGAGEVDLLRGSA